MYQSKHRAMASDSDNSNSSADDLRTKDDSDQETGAWLTEVTEWHKKISKKNLGISSGSEDEAKPKKKPSSIITPAKFLYNSAQKTEEHSKDSKGSPSKPKIFDIKPVGNDPQTSNGQGNSGLKRKRDDMAELSDDDDDDEGGAEKERAAEGAKATEGTESGGGAEGEAAGTDENAQGTSKDENEHEGEDLVFQVDCLLYAFSNLSSKWVQKAAGKLSVFDYENEARRFESRFVVRAQTNMNVLLSSKIWPAMSIEKRSQRSIRITALDSFGQAKVYLISVTSEKLDDVYYCLKERIDYLRRKMSVNYLTKFVSRITPPNQKAADGSNDEAAKKDDKGEAAKKDDKDNDRIDPSELD